MASIDRIHNFVIAGDSGTDPIASLTDNSGGTASDTIADTPGSYTEATLANQTASIVAKVNAILAALRATGVIRE